MDMNLSFALNEEDDVLNTTIRDSGTGSVVYIVETRKSVEDTLATTVTRRSQADGSTRFAFRILWRGKSRSLEGVTLTLDPGTFEEVPVSQVLEHAPGGATFGSVRVDDVEYNWKTKGTGSKVILVNQATNETVARSHSRIRKSFFKKPRDMSLDISESVLHAMDVVLLTFILVWKEKEWVSYGPTTHNPL